MYQPSPELKRLEAEKAEAEQQLVRERHNTLNSRSEQ